MPAAAARKHLPLRATWTAIAGRLGVISLVMVGLIAPGLTLATPAAAQTATVSFSTAEAAPADSVAYVVTTLDDKSEQWRMMTDLLDRMGVADAIKQSIDQE